MTADLAVAPAPIFPPSIRPLTAADRDALAALLGPPFDEADRAVALELIDAALADLRLGSSSGYEVRVAEDEAGVVGYICFGPTPMTAGTYDLYWVVAGAPHRGRGIGRALVVAMEDELRSRRARLVRVETSKLESYGAARAFYARIGYPVAATLPDFYKPGDDLIVYLKTL